MSSKIFKLKQAVIKELPKDEVPAVIFGRLMIKSRLIWSKISEKTEVSDEEYSRALKAVEDMFGKRFNIA